MAPTLDVLVLFLSMVSRAVNYCYRFFVCIQTFLSPERRYSTDSFKPPGFSCVQLTKRDEFGIIGNTLTTLDIIERKMNLLAWSRTIDLEVSHVLYVKVDVL